MKPIYDEPLPSFAFGFNVVRPYSLAYFKSLRNRKKKNEKPVVGVLGCMAERLKTQLLEADQLVGSSRARGVGGGVLGSSRGAGGWRVGPFRGAGPGARGLARASSHPITGARGIIWYRLIQSGVSGVSSHPILVSPQYGVVCAMMSYSY